MDLDLLLDPLFRVPVLTGLVLAAVLPLLGCYVRLRDEWLGALGLTQVAAAGGVVAAALGLSPLAGAIGVSAGAAGVKGRLARAGNDYYASVLLAGWAVTLLVAANIARGEDLTHVFLDGQIYFTGAFHLGAVAALAAATAVLLPWLSRKLLVARMFPDHFGANGIPGWRYHAAFDLLVAAALAISTTAIGVMATFALVFVPPWVAFRASRGWRWALLGSLLLALGAYVAGFAAAILLNQPFGPTAVAAVVVLGLARVVSEPLFSRRGRPCRDEAGEEEIGAS
jgi:zinc/manganese transport system permease protein